MSASVTQNQNASVSDPRLKTFTLDLAQAAATYDLCSSSGGDVWIEKIAPVVTIAGAVWTTVAIVTDDTTPWVILAAAIPAVFTVGTTVPTTWAQILPQILRSGKKIQYTIAGATGTGSVSMSVLYRPIGSGNLV